MKIKIIIRVNCETRLPKKISSLQANNFRNIFSVLFSIMAGKGKVVESASEVDGKVEKTAKQLEKEAKKQAKMEKFLQKSQKQPTETKVACRQLILFFKDDFFPNKKITTGQRF